MMVIMRQMQIPLIDITHGDSWHLTCAASVSFTPYIVGKGEEIRMRRRGAPASCGLPSSGMQ